MPFGHLKLGDIKSNSYSGTERGRPCIPLKQNSMRTKLNEILYPIRCPIIPCDNNYRPFGPQCTFNLDLSVGFWPYINFVFLFSCS